jgi:hypothetical protein
MEGYEEVKRLERSGKEAAIKAGGPRPCATCLHGFARTLTN